MEAILFDIGSTLVKGPNLSPNKEIAALLAIPGVDAAQIAQIIMREEFSASDEVWERFKSCFSGVNDSHKEKIRELWNRQVNDASEIEGATEVVKYLKSLGHKIGLISDIWAPYFISFKKACPEIAALADATVLSFKEGVKKPFFQLYTRALLLLGTSPQSAVMVGDTYKNDLAPAMELGLRTVWVLSRPERETEALAKVINGEWQRPTHTVETINDLNELSIWRC